VWNRVSWFHDVSRVFYGLLLLEPPAAR